MRTHLLHSFLIFAGLLVVLAILGPFFPAHRSRHNARRASCQSNLKQIGLALAQYTQDYDEHLPPRQWGKVILPYTKSESLFQCPETTGTVGTNDYFFNARFVGASTAKISSPATLILMGDGKDDAPFDAALGQLPPAWLQDEKSPARRHLDQSVYGFADGHVRSLKPKAINRDFRVGLR